MLCSHLVAVPTTYIFLEITIWTPLFRCRIIYMYLVCHVVLSTISSCDIISQLPFLSIQMCRKLIRKAVISYSPKKFKSNQEFYKDENQYKVTSCTRTKHCSASGESRTKDPSNSSLALHHSQCFCSTVESLYNAIFGVHRKEWTVLY